MGYYSAQAPLSRRGAQTSLCTRRMACTGCACTVHTLGCGYIWLTGWCSNDQSLWPEYRFSVPQIGKWGGGGGEGVDAFAVKRELPWSKNAQRGIYTLPSLHSSQEIGLYLLQQIHSTYNLPSNVLSSTPFLGKTFFFFKFFLVDPSSKVLEVCLKFVPINW